MAYRYDRDDQWNRGDLQRPGDASDYDERRDWERSARERNRAQGRFGSRDEHREENYSQGDYQRRQAAQSYTGEDQWSPRYGQRNPQAPGGYERQFGGTAERGDYWSRYDTHRNRDWEERPYGSDTHENRSSLNRGLGLSGGLNSSGSGYGGGYSGTSYGRDSGDRYGGSWGDSYGRNAGASYGRNWGDSYGNSNSNSYGNNRNSSARYGENSANSYGTYGSRYGSDSDSGAARAGYAGRGPKGYRRSDERIKEDVCDRLSLDDDVDASDITVSVKNGEVTLDGSVETRRMKHRAEDIAESVSGVADVRNNVRVIKGFLNEMVDRVTGTERDQHFANSGTRNAPNGTTTSGASTGGQSTTHQAR